MLLGNINERIATFANKHEGFDPHFSLKTGQNRRQKGHFQRETQRAFALARNGWCLAERCGLGQPALQSRNPAAPFSLAGLGPSLVNRQPGRSGRAITALAFGPETSAGRVPWARKRARDKFLQTLKKAHENEGSVYG